MVTLTIDGREVEVPEGSTILEAAREAGIRIPTLCHHAELEHRPGACRVCLVEVARSRALVASCVHPVSPGMKVRTNSARVRRARRAVVEFLLSDHPQECATCLRGGDCELQQVARTVGLRDLRVERTVFGDRAIDESSPALIRDPAKCVHCLRCVTVCAEVQGVHLLTPEGRGFDSRIVPAMGADLADAACTYCGQCALVCPTGAIVERDDTARAWAALADPGKHVVVQEAPAIRAQLGEEFGLPPGTLVTGKMIAALRRLGFDRVFDTNFTADLTIVEEGHELLQRLSSGGVLPMMTSCSPGWIKFVEHHYPQLLPNVSSCKSPQQMFGALAKTYYAELAGLDPADIVVVSAMPCTAKKYEAGRPEMRASGHRDVDIVLTTRELARMIREAGLDFAALPDEEPDPPMGRYTGAATIFGATGGVMEAALRSVHALVTGRAMAALEVEPVRGLDGVKAATLEIEGLGPVRVAVAHGLGSARGLLDRVVAGDAEYHFIEIMACPGGCVGGGGSPLPASDERRAARAAALYRDDAEIQALRQSHLNPAVQELYERFLGEPLGPRSHHLLHTHYVERGL